MITIRLSHSNYRFHLWLIGHAWQVGEWDRYWRALFSAIGWSRSLPT